MGTVCAAFLLDLAFGDPRWFPHPVRAMGRLARALERAIGPLARRQGRFAQFLAGMGCALAVYGLAFGIPWLLLRELRELSPAAAWIGSALLIYTTLALRSLADHSVAVYRPLRELRRARARANVAMMVGRDTEPLSRREVVRACVESVAENMVDGVTAPLCFAVFFGAPGAMLYRAINTLDSIYGHRDERFEWFGKFAARVDDVANLIPARVSAALVLPAALVLGGHPWRSLRILLRDGGKHPSPNSGLAEAAVAGALGVRLGGTNFYDGIACPKPHLGDPLVRLGARHILAANRLVFMTSVLAGMAFFLARVYLLH